MAKDTKVSEQDALN